MIRHLVSWQFANGISQEEKKANAVKIKKELEGLKNKIEGVQELRVRIELLGSSTADLLLDSCFTDLEALTRYQNHPEHLEIAGFIREVTQNRTCVDFSEERKS